MKRVFEATAGFVVTIALVSIAFAANSRSTVEATINGKKVSIEYGRPTLHGRSVNDMLGKLGAGEFWRLGADKSTTFSTAGDLMFGDVTVPKGEYSLWAQKQADGSWKLVFNKQHGQWGTNHDAAQDFASVPLKTEKESTPAEQVTISLKGELEKAGQISIQWGDMELSASFK
jgi:hypothetical protein